jgi:hypothetical protein
MKRNALPLLLAVAAAACGDTTADEPEPTSCQLAVADPQATVAEGARSRLPLLMAGDISDLSAESSLGEAKVVDGAVVTKTPYGSGGETLELTLSYSCAGETQQTTLSHSVRTIAWAALPSWTPGNDGPLGREYGTMWIDEANPDRMLAWGGFHYQPEQFTPASEFWQYDLVAQSWSQLSPVNAPLRPGGGLALVGEQEAIYFGGLIGNDTPFSIERIAYGTDAPVFSTIARAGDAGSIAGDMQVGDYQPSLFYDAPRGRLVTACGVNVVWGYHCRVRSIDMETGAMTELETAGGAPVGRNGHFWVHDPATERLIVFSGDGGEGGWDCDCKQDTWALELAEEPMRWVQLSDSELPPVGRRNGAFILDAEGHRMLVWGGTPDGKSTAPGLYALDLDRGEERWQLVQPAGESPPERTSGHAVYDAARQRMVVGFGNGAGGVHADLWTLSL